MLVLYYKGTVMKIIGHRGARGLAPENTLAAIEAGIAAGADIIEVDVRITKDGIAILNHDPLLAQLEVSTNTLDDLRKIKPDLATLADGIQAVNRRIPMVIEVKPGTSPDLVASELRQYLHQGWHDTDFFISSFDFTLLQQLSKLLPGVTPTVLERWSGLRASRRAKKLGTLYICMNQRFLWWGFVRSMARSGYKLSAYTINKPSLAARWAHFGLYGVVTDFPDKFKQK